MDKHGHLLLAWEIKFGILLLLDMLGVSMIPYSRNVTVEDGTDNSAEPPVSISRPF
jgi:hypothetical protein